MTREESKKAAEVMKAYADGKKIEYKVRGGDEWLPINELDTPLFDWNSTEYRIKPEITYRSFKDKDECWAEMQKHQPFGWVKKSDNVYYSIYTISAIGINIYNNLMFYNEAFKECVFIDGAPFGIKED